MPSLEKYDRALDYSFAPGIFPSMEALRARPESVRRMLLSLRAQGEGVEKIKALCAEKHIRVEEADKALSRLSGKENCFAAAVTEKVYLPLDGKKNHVVLHHISDSGNLGTILRTALGFGYRDIAVIRPAADVYDPHVIRASMGAIFSLHVREYADFDTYRQEFPDSVPYPFMLDGSVLLENVEMQTPCSLIFGNEGAGLPEEFSRIGHPVRIRQSENVDSLNLSVAAAIGMYHFITSDVGR